MPSFLADANIEYRIFWWLKENKFDVISVQDMMGFVQDEQILEKAQKEMRILITNDKDFGKMVYLQKKLSSGILLLRFRTEKTQEKIEVLKKIFPAILNELPNNFVVITEQKVRIRPLRQR